MNLLPFHAPWLTTAAHVFALGGAPLYAVGGLVRNAVMDLPASDADLCGPARPEQVVSLCEGTPVRAQLRAAHFGTVELHIADAEGRHMAEYTTFRVDSYRCGHQPSAVHFADTLEVDALRRDFSVNALYRLITPDTQAQTEIIDPTGGLSHLRQGVLHTVTDDPNQVLGDDGLRILRAARFQAELGLRPTEALLISAKNHVSLLADIAMERLRDELIRLLLSDMKYPTLTRTEPPVAAGLKTVLRVGAWRALFGNMSPDQNAIAATAYYQAPSGMSPVSGKLALLFYREEPAALAERMRLLRFSAQDTEIAYAALAATRAAAKGNATVMDSVRRGLTSARHANAVFRAISRAGTPCEAARDRAASTLAAIEDQRVPKTLRELAVRGGDLIPICRDLGAPVSRIGKVLDTLWQETVELKVPNERSALLAEARRLFAAI